ncbi:MAG: DUF2339 domain-containing protein [Candidatus Omnitrophica bacterium]|nr:DUF2339 domain-containing protein [Candidatus Omnitrophota bacterium]
MGIFWLSCFILTVGIAAHKKYSLAIWWVLGLLLGPLGVILVLVYPKKKSAESVPTDSDSTPISLKSEIAALRIELNHLTNRLNHLESGINSSTVAQIEAVGPPVKEDKMKPQVHAALAPAPLAQEKQDLEVNVGRFWLNRIGIVIFALGIGFLISYSFRYFGPLVKILFGYAVSVCLFVLGFKMEISERFRNYGRVLLGGGWAVTYFTTYAMYHFDASRVISSQLLDLVLLTAVAFGIIMHSLKYKSQELSAVALAVGYLTATLGDINVFTLISCFVLAVAALVLVFRMQWLRFIIFGIALTYLTHFIWVVKHLYFSRVPVSSLNVEQVYFLVNSGFLFVYWLLFTLAIHCIRNRSDASVGRTLSVANFCNFILFFIMAFPKFLSFYPEYKFGFVFGLGVVYLGLSFFMEKKKCSLLFTSNMLIAIFLLTLAVPLRYLPFHTSVIWLIELPFLVFVGIRFERKLFRYFGLLLSVVIFLKIISYDFHLPEIAVLFGYGFAWNKILSLLGFISSVACFYFERPACMKETAQKPVFQMKELYSALAVVYATIFIWLMVNLQWLTPYLYLEALALVVLGARLRDKFFRAYSLLLLLAAGFRMCFIDNYNNVWVLARWSVLAIGVLIAYCVYLIGRELRKKGLLESYECDILPMVFIVSTFLFTWLMFRYVASSWISVALGLEGVILFGTGFIMKDKVFRWGGFALFGVTIVRVVYVDMAQLPVVYKIISFIVLGILFLGVSFIYTKYTVSKPK